jgi:hypothetical protein
MSDTVMVYTSKPLHVNFEDGGSGNWTASEGNVKSCKYVVLVKSDTYSDNFSPNDIPIGTAFLIGKISGVKRSEIATRLVIQFSEYAEINLPDAWTGNRNPVAYLNIQDLEQKYESFSLSDLTWQPFPSEKVKEVDNIKPLTINEAKLGLAKQLGIDPSNIEIRITA